MARRWFGTDGVRGVFGEPPLERETVTRLGLALAAELADRLGQTPTVVLGGDTRASTPALCRWLASGLEAGGARLRFAGVLPTPGIARLVSHCRAQAGVAISASHNPYPDNGIKLVDAQGFKWETAREAELERRWEKVGRTAEEHSGELVPEPELLEAYLESFEPWLRGQPLSGLSVGLDTANGAASAYAARLFAGAGAKVEVLADHPNGSNINLECGSTHPERLAERVRLLGCDIGFAFDGDADRAILIDEQGEVRDGDAMLYLWAQHLHQMSQLEPARVVATTMSNLGLERALREFGVEVERCGVGDREVVARLRQLDLRLGGEQSGHLVDLRLASTGDGLLSALVLAKLVAASGRRVSELLSRFVRFPQVLLNVPVSRKPPLDSISSIAAAAQQVEERLGRDGRLLLRYSGTEPLARVMVEGPDLGRIQELAEGLAAEIRVALG